MAITKDDVKKALTRLEETGDLSEGEGEEVSKAGEYDHGDRDKAGKAMAKNGKGGARPGSSGSVPQNDLNTSNGAADGGGSLDAPGDNMNGKYGNKKGSKGKMGNKSMEGEKSVPEDFEAGLNEEVQAKVDVSQFLRSLVDHTAESHDRLRDFVAKSDEAGDARFEELTEDIGKLTKSLSNVGIVLKAICERIGVIEEKPQVAKSQTAEAVETAARPFQKSDPTAENALPPQQSEGLYKSLEGKPPHVVKKAIADKLCDLVMKGEAVDTDVINFETYNSLSPELDEKVRQAFA